VVPGETRRLGVVVVPDQLQARGNFSSGVGRVLGLHEPDIGCVPVDIAILVHLTVDRGAMDCRGFDPQAVREYSGRYRYGQFAPD
jgi:hypothetical protein